MTGNAFEAYCTSAQLDIDNCIYNYYRRATNIWGTDRQLSLSAIVHMAAFKQAYKRDNAETQKQTGINSEINVHKQSPKYTILLD